MPGEESDKPTIMDTIPDYTIVIHGGAGTITRENMTPGMERAYLDALDSALTIGESIIQSGGTALDAVESTIRYLEDNPLFNAGKGSVFTHEGKNEMDASIMDGATQKAGAVACVTNIKNPITAARAVMERTDHVMLAAQGAEQFARETGLDLEPPEYFHTDRRWNSLQKVMEKEKNEAVPTESEKHGTVGCVVLDKHGNLAAGTSTGGMTNKRYNRVGDSPIVGAGTYADNATCAVSTTGHGEYFMRYVVAYDIAARMEHGGVALQQAADDMVMKKLVDKGGSGGIIAVDHKGNIAMVFNSEGMYRGFAKPGERVIKIYRD